MPAKKIPLHYFDNTHQLKSTVICLTLKFDDVLDADMLHESLIKLIKNDHWRKIGGQVRIGLQGRPVVHVFSLSEIQKGEPVVKFSKVHHDMSMADHPVASKLHHSTYYPSAQPGVEQFRSLTGPNARPTSFEDYLSRYLPQIFLHIVTFSDGTLMSLTWPHTMSDISGWGHIFRAWSGVLAGKRWNAVPHLAGYDTDVLEYFGRTRLAERSLVAPIDRKFSSKVGTFARRVEHAVQTSQMKSRLLCLPRETLDMLEEKTTHDMILNHGVTEMDVIKEYLVNIACAHMGSSDRNVVIHGSLDLRRHYPTLAMKPGVYIQNATLPYVALVPLKTVAEDSFGQTAVAIHRAYELQRPVQQLIAIAQLLRTSNMRDELPVLGDKDGHHIYFAEWPNVRFHTAIDFRPAVVPPPGEATTGNTPNRKGVGRPSYFHSDVLSKSALHDKDVFNLYGKDNEGNYWIGAVLHKKAMKNFDREFAVPEAGNGTN
ncbi:hypothetical protein DPV78_012283 [Talaromyces pinophilus]|nr:hypothetical protein DPV78_012283 [Talaromyces pinophilus]